MADPVRDPAPAPASDTAFPTEQPLALGVILAYCLPMVGVSFMGMLFGIYLMKFSTDVLLIAPFWMGLLIGIGRIWDGLSDPLAGYLSDRSTARRGRRRAWMFAAAVPIAASTVMLWAPPPMLGGLVLVAWMGVAMLLYETAATVFFVPYGALGAELTLLYHDRTRLFAYRHVIGAAGSGLGLGGVYLIRTADDPRLMALAIALLGGAAVAGMIFLAAVRLPERAEFQGRGAVNFGKGFLDVLRNPHARLLLIVYGVETFGTASIGMLAPYIMQYVVKRPDLTEAFILVYFVPQFALTPAWVWVSRRVGKKKLWLLSMAMTCVAYFSMFFIAESSFGLLWFILVLLGLSGGCGAVVAPSIQADVIDYDEYLTGERKEGSYFAVWNFIRKSAGGITMVATGFVLEIVGYVPNAEQNPSTITAMLALLGLLPGTCFLVGTLLFLRFALNEPEHTEIRRELDRRAASRAEESPRATRR